MYRRFLLCACVMYAHTCVCACVCVCVCVCVYVDMSVYIYTHVSVSLLEYVKIYHRSGKLSKHSCLAIFDEHLVSQTNQRIAKDTSTIPS